MSFIYVNREFVEKTKKSIKKGEGIWNTVKYELIRKADESMIKGPWSVTYYPSKAASGNPHDYYSEAPYWWPDPKDPNAPFIRRDGQIRPERFIKHYSAFSELADTMMLLIYAGYYLDEKNILTEQLNC